MSQDLKMRLSKILVWWKQTWKSTYLSIISWGIPGDEIHKKTIYKQYNKRNWSKIEFRKDEGEVWEWSQRDSCRKLEVLKGTLYPGKKDTIAERKWIITMRISSPPLLESVMWVEVKIRKHKEYYVQGYLNICK